MGKVYEALRRAEEQRSHALAGEPPLDRVELEWTPAPARSTRRPRLSRLRSLLRGRAADPAVEVNKRRVVQLLPDSFVAEQFRSLRARLDALASQRALRVLAVTSAAPGEGKSTAAINLAMVSAMSVGRRVLLVDADMRSPQVHRTLGLRPRSGLAEVLAGDATVESAIQRVEGNPLEVLPVRHAPTNPAELLSSPAMRDLIGKLSADYDLVILDTPPLLSLPDAKSVSEITDGVVLVVRAGATQGDDVEAALDLLDRRRVLGVILNGADVPLSRYQYR